MLKKILILALILNTQYILPSHSSPNPKYDLAVSCAGTAVCAVSGIMCAKRTYQDFKKGLQALKEIDRQIKILKEMGAKVHKVSQTSFEYGYIVTREHYEIKIPSNFSQQQVEKAKEHWDLLLANDKYTHESSDSGTLALIGAVILIPLAIGGLLLTVGGLLTIFSPSTNS